VPGCSTRTPQLLGEPQERLQLLEALLRGQREISAQEGSVHIAHVPRDDRIVVRSKTGLVHIAILSC